MARYTGLFAIALPLSELYQLFVELLESCNLELMHQTPNSIIAREFIGTAPTAQLVTIEVVFETATSTETETRMRLEASNGELPLQLNNRCHQIFEAIHQVIIENYQWDTLESIAV